MIDLPIAAVTLSLLAVAVALAALFRRPTNHYSETYHTYLPKDAAECYEAGDDEEDDDDLWI